MEIKHFKKGICEKEFPFSLGSIRKPDNCCSSTDFDLFSPLIFNWRSFRKTCPLAVVERRRVWQFLWMQEKNSWFVSQKKMKTLHSVFPLQAKHYVSDVRMDCWGGIWSGEDVMSLDTAPRPPQGSFRLLITSFLDSTCAMRHVSSWAQTQKAAVELGWRRVCERSGTQKKNYLG